MAGTNKHVVGLDVLRVLAATMVACYHFLFWHWTRGMPFAAALPGHAPPTWGFAFNFGWVGVEIFFVISGFVIAWSASGSTAAGFLRSRFLRLAPVSWVVATLIVAGRLAMGEPHIVWPYVSTVIFWPFNAIDPIWWTLGIEISFYLLTYALLRLGRIALLEPVMVAVGVASGVFWLVSTIVLDALGSANPSMQALGHLIQRAQGNRELQLMLVQHGCLFGLGVVIWALCTHGVTQRRLWSFVALAISCMLEINGQNSLIARLSGFDLSVVPPMAVWTVAVGLLLLSTLANEHALALVGRSAPLFRFAGVATYPLYLVHNYVGTTLIRALTPALGQGAIAVGLLGSFLAAAIVAWVIEPPVRRLLGRIIPSPSRSGAHAPAIDHGFATPGAPGPTIPATSFASAPTLAGDQTGGW